MILSADSGSPLHGVLILVKDNIVTQGRPDVSAGPFALLGANLVIESLVVSKLRRASVIILGKTNLSEWANFGATNSSSGWSPRGGQTMGTNCPDSNLAGSSSGSAVATSLGLCTSIILQRADMGSSLLECLLEQIHLIMSPDAPKITLKI